MHIPDGYLDPVIAGVFFILAAVVLGLSLFRLREVKVTPLFGVLSAAIFVAQMLNWPIPGGTSAHFAGGALAGILLGPYAGVVAMSIVLTIQTLVFNDGGITAWGANVWNMAVVNVVVGYYLYGALERYSKTAAAFVAGWAGVTLAAIFVGLELGLSTAFAYGLAVTIPVMAIWHALLGVVEGVITAGAVGYIAGRRPEVLRQREVGRLPYVLLGVMIILAPVFAYLAEQVGYREPLGHVAEELGLREVALNPGLLPDYTEPGLDPYLGTFVSGVVGAAVVLLVALVIRHMSRYAYTA
ncbi:MAG: energy-coupling factor ABC transporter permease [Pyrobaculum sp.]